MSIKSFIQILILLLIILILSTVYYKYFKIDKKVVEEINSLEIDNEEQLKNLERKILELEIKNEELAKKVENKEKIKNIPSINNKEKLIRDDKSEVKEKVIKDNNSATEKNITNKKIETNNKKTPEEIKNFVKDVEYISTDDKGNKFYLLANSGKSNIDDNDILDLVNVRGKIKSHKRDTIYIVSDFAQFNSVNSNSKFYDNVIINYQEKQITCLNFDINMETNKAIAYNDVLITDPKSSMRAGLVEFDLKTKNININPETVNSEIKVVTN